MILFIQTENTLHIIFSDAAGVSLLRQRPRDFGRAQPHVPDGESDFEPPAQRLDHQADPGGIMVAFGVREALTAEQIYWAGMEDGKRQFRQYMAEATWTRR